jgi:peroxiredoxin
VALCGLILASAAAAVPQQPELGHSMSRLEQPVVAPDFRLQDMDGTEFRLDQYRGKVVLVNFWATWCPPCRREMPSLQRLHAKMASEGLQVLAVNQWEDPDLVFAYMGQISVDAGFPILFDPESKVAEAYQVQGLPTTFLIDTQGRLRYRAIGGREFDHPEIEALVRKLLAEP